MIQNAYKTPNEILFTTSEYPGFTLIESREFTQDELEFPKIEKGKITVDIDKQKERFSMKRLERIRQLKFELSSKIDAELSEIVKKYPKCIADTFSIKSEEASKLLSGKIAHNEATIIFHECQKVYGTLVPTEQNCFDLAKSIQSNAVFYKKFAGEASGLFKVHSDEIENCPDILNYRLPERILS